MLNILGHTAEGATSNLVQSADFIEKTTGGALQRPTWPLARLPQGARASYLAANLPPSCDRRRWCWAGLVLRPAARYFLPAVRSQSASLSHCTRHVLGGVKRDDASSSRYSAARPSPRPSCFQSTEMHPGLGTATMISRRRHRIGCRDRRLEDILLGTRSRLMDRVGAVA
jgi:hypothetical protein